MSKLNLCLGVVKIHEPMLVQIFKANASVEAFDECIVREFSRSAAVEDDTIRIGPQVELARSDWAAIVKKTLPSGDPRFGLTGPHQDCSLPNHLISPQD